MRADNQNTDSLSRRQFLALAAQSYLALRTPDFVLAGTVPEKVDGKAEFEVVDVNQYKGVISTNDSPVIFVPLRGDYFLDEGKEIESWLVGNVSLGFNKILTLKRPDGTGLRIATLNHTTGLKTLPLAIVDTGAFNLRNHRYIAQREYVRLLNSEDIRAEFAMVGDYAVYKQHNLLEGAKQILLRQQENGPFLPGEQYSFLDITRIGKNRGYKLGGGGICGLATTLAQALGQMPIKANERWAHNLWKIYWLGPMNPDISVRNDTTVELSDRGKYDFRWTPLTDSPHYISFQTSLAVTAEPTRNEAEGINSRIFIHLMMTTGRPDFNAQIERINSQIEAYGKYNKEGTSSPILRESRPSAVITKGFSNSDEALVRVVYKEEDVQGFERELSESPYLKDIVALREVISQYSQDFPYENYIEGVSLPVGEYIRNSSWYQKLTKGRQEKIEGSLRHLNYHTYVREEEAVQCIGWVILLADLGFTGSPKSIDSNPAATARELIPEELFKDKYKTEIWEGSYHFISPKSLDEIETGDLFVTYSLKSPNGAGHVGAIVAKKMINGETVLLLSDANRKHDGKVRIFRVDKSNELAIFGEPPHKWVVIRKHV